jgi:hypothetical protein
MLKTVARLIAALSLACDDSANPMNSGGGGSGSDVGGSLSAGGDAISAGGTTVTAKPWTEGLDFPPIRDNGDEWIVTPVESTTAFRNPGKGWVMYDYHPMTMPGLAEETPLADVVYSNYINWGDLQPYKGAAYRFWLLDQWFAKYPGRKFQFAITLLLLNRQPEGSTGFGQLPTWIKNELCPSSSNCAGRMVPGTFGPVFEPDYSHPLFLKYHKELVEALAQRYYHNDPQTTGYDGAPDWSTLVEGIDLGTYGKWGEWHSDFVWPGSSQATSDALKKTTLRTMIDHYYDAFAEAASEAGGKLPAFEQSCVGSALDGTNADGTQLQPTRNHIYDNDDPNSVLYSVDRGSRMVRKFLGADPRFYFHSDEQRIIADHVATAPLRLEWGSFTGALNIEAFKPQDPALAIGQVPDDLDGAIDRGIGLRTSLLGWYTDPQTLALPHPSTGESRLEYAQKHVGYRFYVDDVRFPKQVKRGAAFPIRTTWHNRANAKNYRHMQIRAYLASTVDDVALPVSDSWPSETWPLGIGTNIVASSFAVPSDLVPGGYALLFAIVDDQGAPAMNLAIEGKAPTTTPYGRYVLGILEVQ